MLVRAAGGIKTEANPTGAEVGKNIKMRVACTQTQEQGPPSVERKQNFKNSSQIYLLYFNATNNLFIYIQCTFGHFEIS